MGDHLVHGGDTGSSTDSETVSKLVGLVRVFGNGSLEGQGLSWFEVRNVLGHLTILQVAKNTGSVPNEGIELSR